MPQSLEEKQRMMYYLTIFISSADFLALLIASNTLQSTTNQYEKQRYRMSRKRSFALIGESCVVLLRDRTGFCLFKMSDYLNFFKIEKFKDPVSISNNQCLKYVYRQCVSSEDTIFTVHIGYDCLRGFHKARQ